MSAAPAGQSRHRSEDIIINAPMSFAGAAQRAFRLRRMTFNPPLLANILMTTLAILLTLVWWWAVLLWYATFGLLLVPYRLLRRQTRREKKEALETYEYFVAKAEREKET